MASTTLPVTVEPEAAARLAELGFQAQVDRMIDYARQNLPHLVRIEVVLNDRYDMGGEPGVAIEVYSQCPFDEALQVVRELDRWQITEFPPEVLEHLHMDYHPGADRAG
jgi:hypothetical protein